MTPRACQITGPQGTIRVGDGHRLTIIAGPCVLESVEIATHIGDAVRHACAQLDFPYVFKASYDKANRTSIRSPRGPGMDEGLEILRALRDRLGCPVTTDIHAPDQAEPTAEVVDVLQIPAFLCRQTDLLVAAGAAAKAHGRTVNVKKGQFISPEETIGPVGKLREAGCDNVILTERGTFFGYHRLVNDFMGLGDLLRGEFMAFEPRPPICFDATHSVQLPGSGVASGGRREHVPLLARAAVAAGVDALFFECHPDPEKAPSDGSNMLALDQIPVLLRELAGIRDAIVTP